MGDRFHADLHIAAAAAADPARADGTLTGGTLLYDPAGNGVRVCQVMISVGAAMRVAVGLSDTDNQRLRAGSFGANGGAAPGACWEGPPGGKLLVFHSAQGAVDVSIDGELISAGT
jgi:hypothetical protein